MKRCPKCGQLNRTYSIKCFSCGYIFTKHTTSNLSINLSNSSVFSAYASYCRKHPAQMSQYNVLSSSTSTSNRVRSTSDTYTSKHDNKSISFKATKEYPSYDVQKKLKYITNLQNHKISRIDVKHQGNSFVLKNNKNRLLQCYETYHNVYKEPPLYRLIKRYSWPINDILHKFKLINAMSLALNLKIPKLEIPQWLYYYSYQFSNYVKQVKGSQGETWACNDLRKHKCYDYAHNINIPFNYSRYYRHIMHHDRRKYHQYKHKANYQLHPFIKYFKLEDKYKKMLEYHKKCYRYSLGNRSYNNSNQIDILHINHYGIYIYEIKNYNHKTMWINKHGEMKWRRLKPAHGLIYGGQDSWNNVGTLTIKQQIILHKAAIMSALRTSGLFSYRRLKKIRDNLYGILVYVKSPRKNIGIYGYDHSARDYSEENKITSVSQNQCFKAIESNEKQFTFNYDELKAIKHSIFPRYEKAFKLPIFQRSDFNTFKLVYKYKRTINYIYKALRYDCYKHRILNKIDPLVYRYFKYEQSYQIGHIKRLKKYVNVWKIRLNKYKYSKKIKHLKGIYLRKLNLEQRLYNRFYKFQV